MTEKTLLFESESSKQDEFVIIILYLCPYTGTSGHQDTITLYNTEAMDEGMFI